MLPFLLSICYHGMSINSANFPIINGNSFMKFSNRPDDKTYWRCSRSRGGHDNNCTASVTTSNLTKLNKLNFKFFLATMRQMTKDAQ